MTIYPDRRVRGGGGGSIYPTDNRINAQVANNLPAIIDVNGTPTLADGITAAEVIALLRIDNDERLIVGATQPATRENGTALETGDLWIDISDTSSIQLNSYTGTTYESISADGRTGDHVIHAYTGDSSPPDLDITNIPADWQVGDFIYDTVNLDMWWRIGDGGGSTEFSRIVEADELITIYVDGEITTNLDITSGDNDETTIAVIHDYDDSTGLVTSSVTVPTFTVANSDTANQVDATLQDTADTPNVFTTLSVSGGDGITVGEDGGAINVSTTSVAPSHNPYTINAEATGAAVRDDRRFDIPHGSAGGAQITMTATPFDYAEGDRQEFIITSISNIGPFTVASLSGTVDNRVVVDIGSNFGVRTWNVHFTVNYRVNEYSDDDSVTPTSTTNHHRVEEYTVVIDEVFYAGLVAGTAEPTALTELTNEGALANGKEVTVNNTSGNEMTLWLAMDQSDADTVTLTTNGYTIETSQGGTLTDGERLINAGQIDGSLTFVIGGV